jgi:hypothetical protein
MFWADSWKSLAICSVAAIACGGSGCTVWLSTTFVSPGTAMDSTTTTAIQAVMTSQGVRTTTRPNRESMSKPLGLLLAVACFSTVKSFVLR